MTFLVTFYVNSDYISDMVEELLFGSSNLGSLSPLSHDYVKNYQPRSFDGKSESLAYDKRIRYDEFDYKRQETLTFEQRIYKTNIEVLYRFPNKTSISALLLIFHACNHTAREWFHTVERQRIIGAAINLGYGCIVFQSTNRIDHCWSNTIDIYENNDIQMVFKGLTELYNEYPGLANLPRFTFGSASGGMFSSILATNRHFPIHGQIIFIAIILPEILDKHVKAQRYPATAWIHMLRDIEFASEARINSSLRIFAKQNISHKTFPIEPIGLKTTTFRDRLPNITDETSRYLFSQLEHNGWLNKHKFLLYNPRRRSNWREFLSSQKNDTTKNDEITQNLLNNQQELADFLNTAYGEHHISYERSFEALKWLRETYNSSKIRSENHPI